MASAESVYGVEENIETLETHRGCSLGEVKQQNAKQKRRNKNEKHKEMRTKCKAKRYLYTHTLIEAFMRKKIRD